MNPTPASPTRAYFWTLALVLLLIMLSRELMVVPVQFTLGTFKIIGLIAAFTVFIVGAIPSLHAPFHNLHSYLAHLENRLAQTRLPHLASNTWITLAFLLALQIKILWGIWQSWDLPTVDGAQYYLEASRVAQSFTLPPIDRSPLYALIYAIFHLALASAGPFAIYVAHRTAMLLSVNLLMFAFLRRLLSPISALVLTIWFMLLPETNENSFIVHYTILIPILIAALAAISQHPARRWMILAALVAASLIRPEYRVAVAAYGIWQIVTALRQTSWLPAATFALITALTLIAHQFGGSGRDVYAFAQHVAMGYAQRRPELNLDSADWPQTYAAQFGDAATLPQAVLRNPAAAAAHIAWNARLIPLYAFRVYEPFGRVTQALVGFLALLALAEIGVHRPLRSLISRQWSRYPDLWLMFACCALAMLAAILVIRPSRAYMVGSIPMLFLALGFMLDALMRRLATPALFSSLLPLVAILTLIFSPTPYANPRPQPTRHIIEALTEVQPSTPYTLLGTEAYLPCAYLPRCTPLSDPASPISADVQIIMLDLANPSPTDQPLQDYALYHDWADLKTDRFRFYIAD